MAPIGWSSLFRDFLRILVVMAAQPGDTAEGEAHGVVNRVRELAFEHLPSALIAVRRELGRRG